MGVLIGLLAAPPSMLVRAAGMTYYVSTSGLDSNNGLSELTPFKTVAKVNLLSLGPGDRVLFKCGDVWHTEQLVVSKSGTEAEPITFGSYPEGCTDKPVFSGSLPITGWTVHSGSIYRADLPAGAFPLGINQLFRDGQRLTQGRWPNLDAGDGGYSFVDGHSAGSNQITDNELPSAVNWTGAIVHIKNIRWSMLDRQVTGSSGHTLTLNTGLSCLISGWTTCAGWGYFINNHLATLDRDGEWYVDAGANRVYLFSSGGAPSNIEGSVVLEEAATLRHGGIMLSDGSATAYVVVDNIALENWFNHGIGTPGGMSGDIYHHITIRNVEIKDVDAAGVRLSSWLERPSNGRKGLRGGHHMTFTDNVIDGANHFGITGYFAESTFEDNVIKNIALIENLNKSGMGCGLTSSQCTENGDGFRIRTYEPLDSGYGNTLRYNRFEKIGYNGVDVFGYDTTLERNFITQSCYSKADCGGVRTFGSDNLSATDVYDVHIVENIIVDIPGNVDGCHEERPAFGMGLYIDNYSRDVEVRGNTIISTTATGIVYQRSTGQIVDNTVYNASSGTSYNGHISLGASETRVTISGNVLYGLKTNAWTLYSYSLSNFLSSDYNYLFHPYQVDQIAHGPSWT
ncbi:MAG: right-handed parallel beta-helix repeat-containing protein, partial [Anaerolineae bacterium]|nr:right-handed parallel beta-helix repeat-containing protein [Anaerolineae bacterium]